MATVAIFYGRVLDDPLLAPVFDGKDVDALTKKQVAFMSRAFQGPEKYFGRPLNEAHRRLVFEMGLSDSDFDRTALHLGESLRELEVAEALVDEVIAVVESTRSAVLGRDRPPAIGADAH